MEKRLDKILNDQFLQILQKEDFDSSEYITKLIKSSNIENLIDLYINYQNKEKEINLYLEEFSLQNDNFLKNQFNLPDQYGSCFDQIRNIVIQSKRKIKHSKEIFNFNSNKLKLLNKEIYELSTISEELIILDKLNEDLLDIAIFMKKELFLQSSSIFIKIKNKMITLKKHEEKNSTINYFEKIVDKKEKEFLYLLKERLFNMIFDVFLEKYDKDYFIIFEEKNKNVEIKFEKETLYFKYFEDFIKNYKYDGLKYYSENNLNVKTFNSNLFKIKDMIKLFFDQKVFIFLNKELENSSNINILDDFKLIEIIKAANEIDLLENLLKDFIETLDFKMMHYFIKYLKFLFFIFKNTQNVSKFNSNKNTDFNNNYFILYNLRDLGFLEIFMNLLMKLIIIFFQKISFIFKIQTNFNSKAFDTIIEKFFDKFKLFIENFFLSKNMITNFNNDIFSLAELLRKKFEFNHTHLFILLNKINPHFNFLIEKFCKFINQPEKSQIIKMYYGKFEDALFFKFKIKISKIYEKVISNNKKFNKIEKKNLKFKNSKSNVFNNKTNMSEIIKISNKLDSKFFEGITKKKYSINIINNFKKLSNDLYFFFKSNLIKENRFYKEFLNIYNKIILDVFKTIKYNILTKKSFMEILKFKKEAYFRQNLKKIKKALFEELNVENYTKTRLESFLEIPDHFDFSKISINKFWKEENKIGFYEKVFICFYEFYKNEKLMVNFLLSLWNYLDVEMLNKISLTLNITFDLEDSRKDLKTAKNAIDRSGKIDNLIKKIEAKVDLTFEENIILVIYSYFKFRDLILDLMFFLKFNFDYLIFSFFEDSSKFLNKLSEKEKNFFNTQSQIFEFKKLMMSYNKMTKNYIDDDKLQKYFVINSLDYFYKRFHKFIFEIKPIFLENRKLIKEYYLGFSEILASMDILKFYHKEIINKSQNYKLMKKLLSVEQIDNLQEIGITFGLEEDAEELEFAKQSILLYSQIPMQEEEEMEI